ncbi:MAG: YkgJ family cysteine cluster protein [Proteobacteria bacterium]|nr:YkgJ family cysteine cluster protein [Pseudomonadota bacterium]
MQSRQQRRAKLKEYAGLVSRKGIDLRQNDSHYLWSVMAETRMLLDILQGSSRQRASEAARRMHELYELSAQNNPKETGLACRKGCALCCRLTITSACAPEIFLIARHVRALPEQEREAKIASIRLAAEPAEDGRMRSCGLLVNNSCSIYEKRPGACRAYTSMSLKDCEDADQGKPVNFARAEIPLRNRTAHSYALSAALKALNLPHDYYEFRSALRMAIDNPDAEERWLAGEDVFAGVQRDPGPQVQALELLIAGATGKELPAGVG